MASKRKQPKTADWKNLPYEKWNTTTVHAYLIDRNQAEYGVEYVPFGGGPVGKRWPIEKGQIKRELNDKGAEVIKRFIDICFDKHTFNPEFPSLSWGFMYAYMRNDLAKAQAEVDRQAKFDEAVTDVEDVDDDWF